MPYLVGFTESALIDRDRLPPMSERSLRHAVDRLATDPRPNSPYRQEFDLAKYAEILGVDIPRVDARYVRWAFGNVIIDYMFSVEGRVVVIVALTSFQPL